MTSLWSSSTHDYGAHISKRWSASAISLALHLVAIGLLSMVNVDLSQPDVTDISHYQVVMLPREAPHDRVIWYNTSQPLPDIAPEERFGPADKPTGNQKGPVLIARSEDAVSRKQTIRQPEHPEPLPEDLPAPNLVAVQIAPADSKPILRPFTAPPAAPKPQPAPTQINAPPSLADSKLLSENDLGALLPSMKAPTRPFVAPAAHPNGTGDARREPSVPDAAPPGMASPLASASGLDAVLAGLNPASVSPPQGSRPGQFARAPSVGVPSSGATQPGMATAPGLVSRGTPVAPSVLPPNPAADHGITKEYKEFVLPGVNRTMSAPLRPSSRIIPASVEAQFTNRNVYTLVIPNPVAADYSGDWVMWFAERDAREGESLRISAPIPSRKYFRAEPASSPGIAPVKAPFQLAAIIDRAGRLADVRVLRGNAAVELRRRAMEDLATWEFKPTLRNGEPIDVDVVLEIPFQLRVETVSSQ